MSVLKGKNQKPREEMSQRERYMTLVGDPIHQNTVLSCVTGSDFQVMGISAAFLAAATYAIGGNQADLTGDLLGSAKVNIINMLVTRGVFERYALREMDTSAQKFLLDKEVMQKLCIDTAPEPAACINSVTKYGMGIRNARYLYGSFLALGAGNGWVLPTISALAEGDTSRAMNALSKNAVLVTRLAQGFYRFNKLAKGDWAIVDTPEPEKVTERHADFIPA